MSAPLAVQREASFTVGSEREAGFTVDAVC